MHSRKPAGKQMICFGIYSDISYPMRYTQKNDFHEQPTFLPPVFLARRVLDLPSMCRRTSPSAVSYSACTPKQNAWKNDFMPVSTKVKTPSSIPTRSIGWTGQPSDTKPVLWPVTEKCWRWHTLILTVCRSAKSSPWFWRRWQKNSQAARAERQASERSPLCCRMPQKITSCSPERVKYMNTASVLTFQKRGVSFICGLFAQSTLHWLSVNRIRRKNSNGAHPV